MSISRWQKRLENFVDLVLPTDYPRVVPPKIVEAEGFTEISSSISIQIAAKYPQSSLYDVTVGCFAVLLHRYTQEDDIVIGSSSVSSNPLVLRFQVSSSNTIPEVIDSLKAAEKDALSDEIAYKDLLDALFPNHQKSLFKVRFVNQQVGLEDSPATSSSCDMTVFVQKESNASTKLKLVYNSVLFSQSRVNIILAQLSDLLLAAVSNDSPIGKISLAGHGTLPNPQSNLDWEGFKGPITDIFSENAIKFPNRICVSEGLVMGSRTFTYKQINDASNIVANHLISTGIEREDVVVLYSYRGVDLVVAVMGVLKAGATFSVIGRGI
jgi:L-2-aminoadipate reductase